MRFLSKTFISTKWIPNLDCIESTNANWLHCHVSNHHQVRIMNICMNEFRVESEDGGSIGGLREARKHAEPDVHCESGSGECGHFLVSRHERYRRRPAPSGSHWSALWGQHGDADQPIAHYQPAAESLRKLHLPTNSCWADFCYRSRYQW